MEFVYTDKLAEGLLYVKPPPAQFKAPLTTCKSENKDNVEGQMLAFDVVGFYVVETDLEVCKGCFQGHVKKIGDGRQRSNFDMIERE